MTRMKSNHDMFQKMGNPWVTERDRKKDYPPDDKMWLVRLGEEILPIEVKLARKRRPKAVMPPERRTVLERLPNNISVRAAMRRAMAPKKVVVR